MASNPLKERLEVSVVQAKKLSFCKATPRHFEEWLQQIPALDPLSLANTLYNALAELSQLKIDALKLFKCTTLLEPHLIEVEHQLSQRYLTRSAKLTPDQAKVAELANAINHLVIKCYNRSIIAGIKPEEDYMFAIGRTIDWLFRLIFRRCALYLPLPPAVWQQLNALYAFAEQKGWLAHLVKLEFTPSREQVTLQNLYVQSALLTCSQPFQLQQPQICQLIEALPSLASITKLVASKPHGAYLFEVDLSQDNPPRYYKLTDTKLGAQHRFLDLENILSAPGAAIFSSRVSNDLTQHLRRVWTKEPSREYERIAARNDHVDFTIGINNTFAFLTNGQTMDEFVEQYHESLQEGPDDSITLNHTSNNVKVFKGKRINISEGGLCLELDPIPPRIESGDLLSLILPQTRHVTLTVIRWVRLVSRTAATVGCELLSLDAEACVMQIVDERGSSYGIMPALLLDNVKGQMGNPRLVCANSAMLSHKIIKLMRQKGRIMVCKLTQYEVITGSAIISQFSDITEGEVFWY